MRTSTPSTKYKIHPTIRTCIACRTHENKNNLVRIVRTGQGNLAIASNGTLAGRGAYLCRLPDCWEKAIDKGALQRGFKQDIPGKDLEAVKAYYEENIASHTPAP